MQSVLPRWWLRALLFPRYKEIFPIMRRTLEIWAATSPRTQLSLARLVPLAVLLHVFVLGCFLPVCWGWLADKNWFGFSERLGFAVASSVHIEVTFWLANLLIVQVERTSVLYARWAILKPAPYPTATQLRKCLGDVALSHALRPLLLWLAVPLFRSRGCNLDGTTPLSSLDLVLHLAFAVVLDDTIFYCIACRD